MNAPLAWILLPALGLALGWGSATISRTAKHGNDAAPGTSQPSPSSAKSSSRTPRIDPDGLPDIAACRRLLERSSAPDSRHPLLRRLDRERALRRWLELDPDSALQQARNDPGAPFARDLFRAWIQLNPVAALEVMETSSSPLMRAVSKSFFIDLLRKDPLLAAQALQSPAWRDGGSARLPWDFHSEVYRQWMRSDPDAAIASLGPPGTPFDTSSGDSGALAILAEWAKRDFASAWNHLTSGSTSAPGRLDWNASEVLAQALLSGSEDARRTLEETTRANGPLANRQADIASSMVRGDPLAALKWAESLDPESTLRKEILALASRQLASSDPDKALALLAESGGSEHSWETSGVLWQAFASLASRDPADAAAKIRKLPAELRADAMSGFLTQQFRVDADAAIAQCRAWLTDSELQSQIPAAWAKAFSWSHGAGARDPGAILDAIPALSDAVDPDVLSTWTKANPEAAAVWIRQRLEDGKEVKFGDEGILADLASQRPAFTANWLQTLPDPALQSRAANTLVANWAAYDPAAARQWIASLPPGKLRQSAETGLTRTNRR